MNEIQQILNYLERPISDPELEIHNSFSLRFKNLSENSQNITQRKLKEFSVRRMFGSGTLSSTQSNSKNAMVRWDEVNQFIHQRIAIGETPTFQSMQKINSILDPENRGHVRKMFSMGGDKKYIRPEDLDQFIEKFNCFLLSIPTSRYPLWSAFMLYSWGCSIHPFLDGNGRTFRSCADWVLLQNNFLPLTFINSIDAHVAVSQNTELPFRDLKFRSFLNGVMNSYLFIYGEPDNGSIETGLQY